MAVFVLFLVVIAFVALASWANSGEETKEEKKEEIKEENIENNSLEGKIKKITKGLQNAIEDAISEEEKAKLLLAKETCENQIMYMIRRRQSHGASFVVNQKYHCCYYSNEQMFKKIWRSIRYHCFIYLKVKIHDDGCSEPWVEYSLTKRGFSIFYGNNLINYN